VRETIRSRWVEVESAFESLLDLDRESRLHRLTEIAVVDVELANAVAELLAADGIERSALDLDAALLVAAVRGGFPGADSDSPESDTDSEDVDQADRGSGAGTDAASPLPRRIGLPDPSASRTGERGEVFEAERDVRRVAVKRLLCVHRGSEIAVAAR
jgi:hypothetical protein